MSRPIVGYFHARTTMRCAEHLLAVGPDGLCALCRRQAHPQGAPAGEDGSEEIEASAAGFGLGLLLGLLAVLSAASLGIGYAITRLHTPVSQAQASNEPTTVSVASEGTVTLSTATRGAQEGSRPEGSATVRGAAGGAPSRETGAEGRSPSRGESGGALGGASEGAASTVKVALYSTRWCQYCSRARSWLKEHHQPYDEWDVERDPTAASKMRTLNPGGGVPTIDVDGEVMVGFEPSRLETLLQRAQERRKNHAL